MARKCLVLLSLAAVVLALGVDVALAKAVKQELKSAALDLPNASGKAMLNYCADEFQVIANVNCSGLAADTTYTVEVLDGAGQVMASEDFTTKPDKAKKDKPDNGKGNDNKPKKHGKSKGHVNIHIPWDPLALPPNLTTWSVVVKAGLVPVLTP